MRLLVVTQVIDANDAALGFFARWLEALSKQCERIEAVCLKVGTHMPMDNVRVHSLGKENGSKPALVYGLRFLFLAWKRRHDYDAVFVHMNQEYVLIAGVLWKLMGKRVYFWRNHYAGSFLTDVAAAFCEKVFCTSKHSYTAKYKKTVFMPVGVDTERFSPDASVERVPRSILVLARVSESKRPGVVVDALIRLAKRGVDFTASFVGPSRAGDEWYLAALRQRVADAKLAERITFTGGVRNDAAADLYRRHAVFVNAAPSGMLDKTIFEAAASGCAVLAASDDWRELAGDAFWFDGSADSLDLRLEAVLKGAPCVDPRIVEAHALSRLMERLASELYSPPSWK